MNLVQIAVVTISFNLCRILSKCRFKVNLHDKGTAKTSNILEVLPHPNIQRSDIYEFDVDVNDDNI